MTTPAERTRTVMQTARFLRELAAPARTPGVPAAIRCDARRLLRHFPGVGERAIAASHCPHWWGDPEDRDGRPAVSPGEHGRLQ